MATMPTWWRKFRENEIVLNIGVLMLRLPAILLSDIWYRGYSNEANNVYTRLVQIADDAGLAPKDSWPVSPLACLRCMLLPLTVSLILGHLNRLGTLYKNIMLVLVLYIDYFLRQMYTDLIYSTTESEDQSTTTLDICLPLDELLCKKPNDSTVCLTEDAPSVHGLAAKDLSLAVGMKYPILFAAFALRILMLRTVGKRLQLLALVRIHPETVKLEGGVYLTTALTYFLYLIGWPLWFIGVLNFISCWADVLNISVTIILFTYLIILDHIGDAKQVIMSVKRINPQVDIVKYMTIVYWRSFRKSMIISWVSLFAFQFIIGWLIVQPKVELTLVDRLIIGLVESASSPIAFIGVTFAIGLTTYLIWTVVVMVIYATTAVDVAVSTDRGVDIVTSMCAAATPLYFLGMLTDIRNFLVFMISHPRAVLLRDIQKTVWGELSIPGQIRDRKRLRAVVVCIIFAVMPLYVACYAFQTFLTTDWAFFMSIVTTTRSIEMMGILAKCVVFAIDEMTTGEAFNNVSDAIHTVQKCTQICSWVISGFLAFVVFQAVFWSEWKFTAVLTALSLMEIEFRQPFMQYRAASEKRKAVRQLVDNMANTTDDDEAVSDSYTTERTDEVCTICYVELSQSSDASRQTPCGHYFHRDCLVRWLDIQPRCPICSYNLMSSETTVQPPDDQQEAEDTEESSDSDSETETESDDDEETEDGDDSDWETEIEYEEENIKYVSMRYFRYGSRARYAFKLRTRTASRRNCTSGRFRRPPHHLLLENKKHLEWETDTEQEDC